MSWTLEGHCGIQFMVIVVLTTMQLRCCTDECKLCESTLFLLFVFFPENADVMVMNTCTLMCISCSRWQNSLEASKAR